MLIDLKNNYVLFKQKCLMKQVQMIRAKKGKNLQVENA